MWTYNYTDELYHFKYTRKYLKNGKYVYVYPEQGGHYNSPNDFQKWKSLTTKRGFNVTGYTGKNSNGSYAGFDIGKPRDNYKFKEHNKKIGNYTINTNNENGQRSVTIYKNNKSNKNTNYKDYVKSKYKDLMSELKNSINKGRSKINSIINKLRKR